MITWVQYILGYAIPECFCAAFVFPTTRPLRIRIENQNESEMHESCSRAGGEAPPDEREEDGTAFQLVRGQHSFSGDKGVG